MTRKKKIIVALFAMLVSVFLIVASIIFLPLVVNTRKLTSNEQVLATGLFENSVDVDDIRINEGGILTWVYPGVTIGNTISFPINGFDMNEEKDRALFAHELTHVWQYQNFGWGYLPAALYEEITQPDAYVVYYDATKPFVEYDLEEQGEIVAEYYLDATVEYEPYMEELRSTN